jgi:Zn-dependent protease
LNGSLKIGNAFGIPVRIHWTFLLALYLLALAGVPVLQALPLVIVVFGCVLLHELGHSLVARSFGIQVVDITFWPLGGMARMSEIPESSRIEGLVAIAGPAVNFALAGLGVLLTVAAAAVGFADEHLRWFVGVNAVQGLFNLIPAFPMDGGRLLRAYLARKRDWLSATETAVRVGRFVAFLLFVASVGVMLVQPGICVGPLIALFVWIAGSRELITVRLRHGAMPFGGAPWRPAEAANASGGAEPESPDSDPSGPSGPRGPRRPATFDPRQFREGYSDEAVRRLESYRGRLRPPTSES